MGGTRPGQNYQNNDLTSEELNEIESEYLKKIIELERELEFERENRKL